MGSMSSRIDDLTSTLDQVRQLLISQAPGTSNQESVSSAVVRSGPSSVSMLVTSAPSLPFEVSGTREVRGHGVMEDPMQAMAGYVIPSTGKNHWHLLVNMMSVAFNLPESVKTLIKNNLTSTSPLLKGKSKAPSSLCKTVTSNSTTFTLTDYVCPPFPFLTYLDWNSVSLHFMSVHLLYHPLDSIPLIMYILNIRDKYALNYCL